MTMRGRGRPSRPADGVSPTRILSEALRLLDEGAGNLTMRALATRAEINPMTVYHHFRDQDGLISALADMVYADVRAPGEGSIRSRVEGLLRAYRSKVLRHPALTLSIFSRPGVFPDHARRITESLARLLRELGLPPAQSTLWTHILVDYTHGASLATAMGGGSGNVSPATSGKDDDMEFARAVSELLDRLQE